MAASEHPAPSSSPYSPLTPVTPTAATPLRPTHATTSISAMPFSPAMMTPLITRLRREDEASKAMRMQSEDGMPAGLVRSALSSPTTRAVMSQDEMMKNVTADGVELNSSHPAHMPRTPARTRMAQLNGVSDGLFIAPSALNDSMLRRSDIGIAFPPSSSNYSSPAIHGNKHTHSVRRSTAVHPSTGTPVTPSSSSSPASASMSHSPATMAELLTPLAARSYSFSSSSPSADDHLPSRLTGGLPVRPDERLRTPKQEQRDFNHGMIEMTSAI